MKYKANGVVAVSIPILALEIFGGFAADQQIAGTILVQSADNVQQSGFAAAGMSQNGHKFRRPEGDAYTLQRGDCLVAGGIFFNNIGKF